jgi:type IV pilus assembly protein PilB
VVESPWPEGETRRPPGSHGLVVLADGSTMALDREPKHLANRDWELFAGTRRALVRDVDLWFSEAAMPMPADHVRLPQPLPIAIHLPDHSRLAGNLLGVHLEDGFTWLCWLRDGREREVRISDSAIQCMEIVLRARATAEAAGTENCSHSAFAELADGTRLNHDAVPRRLSDGSWHLNVDGRLRVVAPDMLWIVETEVAPPIGLAGVDTPLKVAVVLPGGERIEGELLGAQMEGEALWLRWRRQGHERNLRIAAAIVATLECTMQPRQSPDFAAAEKVSAAAAQVPLLRSAADLDAYVVSHVQGQTRALEPHFHVDAQTWQRHVGDTHVADVLFRHAHRFGMPLIDPATIDVPAEAIAALSPDAVRRFHMVPLRITPTLLAVATDNPSDLESQAQAEFATGRHLLPLLATPAALRAAISRHYDRIEDNALLKSLVLGSDGDDDSDRAVRENERLAREQPIVRLVTTLIDDAVNRRASDIHIRPRADDFEVLFRIDGALIPVRTFAKPLLRAIISRIKVIAGMDITERRLPQDGRVTVKSGGIDIDLRVSVLPSVNGESVVIRLLNTKDGLRNLAEIGFNGHDERVFRDLLARSHGMILVTGPTGCGKSTTLYAALLEARKRDVNIITVEDPVEYHIPDVTQIQINDAIGFDFARTLRNILRHDPDIVMVGEVRDHETAEIAVESALTGHIVLSTLHTNSAATTITRLLDMGVESFLLRSTLLAVLAQRLARRNCRQCFEPEHVEPYVRAALGVGEKEVFYRGTGCQHCAGTGVHGRIAVYELMPIAHELRKLIVPNADADAIHTQAIASGMVPITDHALALARAGAVSLAEVYRIRVE